MGIVPHGCPMSRFAARGGGDGSARKSVAGLRSDHPNPVVARIKMVVGSELRFGQKNWQTRRRLR